MEDNIEKKFIGNRRLILELRFDHKMILADKKGELIENLKESRVFNPYHWEMGAANFVVFNGTKKEDSSMTLNVELNRFSYICRKIDSVEGYYNNFKFLHLQQSELMQEDEQDTYRTDELYQEDIEMECIL